ncbi:MAG: sialate O-acetylesterase [Bacteroidota bacterium]
MSTSLQNTRLRFVCLALLLSQVYCFANVQLSPVFSDHMVLQRNADIHIWGTTDASESVTVSFAGTSITTQSINHTWEVQFPAMQAGGPFTLRIEGSANTLSVNDILIGDVWLCAGQSNMRLRVNQAFDARLAVLSASNNQLRLADWEGRLEPINKKYTLALLQQLNSSNYYSPAPWRTADSASVNTFSAVGYYFGNSLQQALHIPIGLINNSIGGVPVETYIPLQALAADPVLHSLSENNWLTDSLYPSWTAERVNQNLQAWKDEGSKLPMPGHPYQPGYLFDAGIAPLQKLAIKGVIWYQGESNATYTGDSTAMRSELNKLKLQLLVNSWRKHFKDPQLPFIMIQLPAINRDWELYREVQLELAKEMHDISLVVTLDLGNANDVHPRDKKTVGERAAIAALGNVYHKNMVPTGPLYNSYRVIDDKIIVSFSNTGNGLSTKDGQSVRRILICGEDKLFYPATAVFKKNELWLSSVKVLRPVAARYAWEDNPYDANLSNSEGLPASPFRTDK